MALPTDMPLFQPLVFSSVTTGPPSEMIPEAEGQLTFGPSDSRRWRPKCMVFAGRESLCIAVSQWL